MRKIILLSSFFFLFSLNPVMSQSQPLAVENASWLVHMKWMIPFGEGHQFWAYTIKGDTTIGGFSYKKVYHIDCGIFPNGLPNPMPPLQAGMRTLAGFVRDVNQKVYAIKKSATLYCAANTEYLLYDFSYIAGDTTKLCVANYPNYPIYTISNIVQNAPPFNRKTFYTSGGIRLYEGIGSSSGLFEDFTMIDFYHTLEKYSTNGLEGLGILTGLNSLNLISSNFIIYPNPARDNIMITLNGFQTLSGLTLTIYDLQGRLLLNKSLQQNNNEIDISQMQEGVYVAKIKLEDGAYVQKKFVVIK